PGESGVDGGAPGVVPGRVRTPRLVVTGHHGGLSSGGPLLLQPSQYAYALVELATLIERRLVLQRGPHVETGTFARGWNGSERTLVRLSMTGQPSTPPPRRAPLP